MSESSIRAKAAAPPAPFLRWAGGKRQWLAFYGARLPAFTGKYLEPFLGGGAVFFYLHRTRPEFDARLGDINRHLIRTYSQLRDNPVPVSDEFADLVAAYAASSDPVRFYSEQRQMHNHRHPDTNPARFIFLNRTCWNGLWRVNQKGLFNVPHGNTKDGGGRFPSRAELLVVSQALRGVSLRCNSWETTLASASSGDFVFVDPPYFSDVRVSNNRTQQKYHTESFGLREHEYLADALADLSSRGVDFLLTNSAEAEMQDIYGAHGFDIELVRMPRSINSRTDSRSAVEELVVRPTNQRRRPSHAAALLDFEAFRLRTRQEYLQEQGIEEDV
jgi:DNA adenine methylase